MDRYICIHGHFYQPPRENLWLEAIELQDSAYPYHDWNERITVECYAPNTAARILDEQGNIKDIVNNYSKMSFNIGPTLLSWMEKNWQSIYQSIIEADTVSRERFSGHGSAIAQVYNHMIMPLANRRDRYTQVIWGIKDFQERFKRFPEGMWLPEAAVDIETLEVLAECGITFTILAPRQAQRMRKIVKGAKWHDMSKGNIDPSQAYLMRLPSKRSIAIFFYDGPISQDLAYGTVLNSGETFTRRLMSGFDDKRTHHQIVNIATDGETYGHHKHHGDMALAYCLHHIESNSLAHITNYGEYLEKHPPTHLVEIIENTSWSCVHGIERWRSNCGCNSGMHPGWHQAWRTPLRQAMDWLRDRLILIYEQEAGTYLSDIWKARNNYISVINNRSHEYVEKFFEEHQARTLVKDEKIKVLKLLEMQRNAMLMYTSCGWFFDDISGIETTQVLQYATQAMQFVEELTGASLESEYVAMLKNAKSNVQEFMDGAAIYERSVRPEKIDLTLVGVHYAISSLFEDYPEQSRIFCYTAHIHSFEKEEVGDMKLASGKTQIVSDITWDEKTLSFAVLHRGGQNIKAYIRDFKDEKAFATMHSEIVSALRNSDADEMMKLMNRHFGNNTYSLERLFKDKRREIFKKILGSTLDELETSFCQIYEKNSQVMDSLKKLGIPMPKAISVAAEYVLNAELNKIFNDTYPNIERLEYLVKEIKKWSVPVDKETMGFRIGSWLTSVLEDLQHSPDDTHRLEKFVRAVSIIEPLSLTIPLWNAQNAYLLVEKKAYSVMKQRADRGDASAQQWLDFFLQLGYFLKVKVLLRSS